MERGRMGWRGKEPKQRTYEGWKLKRVFEQRIYTTGTPTTCEQEGATTIHHRVLEDKGGDGWRSRGNMQHRFEFAGVLFGIGIGEASWAHAT